MALLYVSTQSMSDDIIDLSSDDSEAVAPLLPWDEHVATHFQSLLVDLFNSNAPPSNTLCYWVYKIHNPLVNIIQHSLTKTESHADAKKHLSMLLPLIHMLEKKIDTTSVFAPVVESMMQTMQALQNKYDTMHFITEIQPYDWSKDGPEIPCLLSHAIDWPVYNALFDFVHAKFNQAFLDAYKVFVFGVFNPLVNEIQMVCTPDTRLPQFIDRVRTFVNDAVIPMHTDLIAVNVQDFIRESFKSMLQTLESVARKPPSTCFLTPHRVVFEPRVFSFRQRSRKSRPVVHPESTEERREREKWEKARRKLDREREREQYLYGPPLRHEKAKRKRRESRASHVLNILLLV